MWLRVIKKWLVSTKNSIAFWCSSISGNTKDPEKTLCKLVDGQSVCYLGAIDQDGFPNIKAMLQPRKHNGLRGFYLSTNAHSQKVAMLESNSKACLYFCSNTLKRGLLLKGTMEVLQDQDSKTMLWEKGDEIYYPDGVTDDGYCVLKFTATLARYYQGFESVDIAISEMGTKKSTKLNKKTKKETKEK